MEIHVNYWVETVALPKITDADKVFLDYDDISIVYGKIYVGSRISGGSIGAAIVNLDDLLHTVRLPKQTKRKETTLREIDCDDIICIVNNSDEIASIQLYNNSISIQGIPFKEVKNMIALLKSIAKKQKVA